MDHLKDKEGKSIYDIQVEIDQGKYKALLLLYDDRFVACVQRAQEVDKVRHYSWKYTEIEGIDLGQSSESNSTHQLLVRVCRIDRSGQILIRKLDINFKSFDERKKFAFRFKTLSDLYKKDNLSPKKVDPKEKTFPNGTCVENKIENKTESPQNSQNDLLPSGNESSPKSVASSCFKVDPLISVESLTKLAARCKTPSHANWSHSPSPCSSPGSRSTRTIIRSPDTGLSVAVSPRTSPIVPSSEPAAPTPPPPVDSKPIEVPSESKAKFSVPLELKAGENSIAAVNGEVVLSLKLKIDLDAIVGTKDTGSPEERLVNMRKFITIETTNCELVFN